MKTERHGTAWRKMGYFLAGLGRLYCRSSNAVPLRKRTTERHGGAEMPPPLCLSVHAMRTSRNGMERHGTAIQERPRKENHSPAKRPPP